MQKEIKLLNGETIAYYDLGSGDKVLLLIHGNTSSSIFFEPLFESLPKDIKIIAPDLRGFGNSSYLKRVDSLLELAEDLKLFLDALKITKVDLLGWSLGGGVAMEFAATYPFMVDKLILLSSASAKGYPIFKKDATGKPIIPEIYQNKDDLALDFVQVLPILNAQANNDLNFYKFIYDMAIYNGKNKPNNEANERWLKEALKQRNLVDVDWALANFNISNEPSLYSIGSNKVANIKAPVLLLWGEKDLTVPKLMLDENIRLFKEAKTITFKEAGHSLLVDEIAELTKVILEFLNY